MQMKFLQFSKTLEKLTFLNIPLEVLEIIIKILPLSKRDMERGFYFLRTYRQYMKYWEVTKKVNV